MGQNIHSIGRRIINDAKELPEKDRELITEKLDDYLEGCERAIDTIKDVIGGKGSELYKEVRETLERVREEIEAGAEKKYQ